MLSFIALVTLFLACVQTAFARCRSYGVDYTDGKTYKMQRSSSPFSGTEEFKGCENDQAHNVLVDPQGNEYECSETPLQPGDTPQQYVCNEWTYDTMYTGEWSIIVISNNGNGEPVNFQRDFYLDFGDSSSATVTSSAGIISETTLLSSLSSISVEVSNPAETTPSETTQTFAVTLFGRDLPAVPTTLLRVMKRNETESKRPLYKELKPEPTTTVEVTLTSHITSFTTVEPTHTPIRVPLKSGRPLSGWNGTNTVEPTYMLASSLMTAASAATTQTITVLEATPTPESSLMALAQPTLAATPAEDHVAPIAPTSLGKHYNDLGKSVAHNHVMSNSNSTGGVYSRKFRMALLHGDKPDAETRQKFVEERHKVLQGSS